MIGVIQWVLEHSEATGGGRLVLLVLAEHAHEDGGEAYPSVDTIARRARMSRRGVQENLRRLEADGHIARDGVSRLGTTVYRVLMGGAESAPPQNPRGRRTTPEGGAPRAPEPPVEPSGTGGTESAGAREPKPDPRTKLPDGFPEHLRPHAIAVYRILRAIAEQHPTAGPVWPLSVGKAIASHPRHPLVAVAHELDGWAVDPPRPIRDVVGTYRTFLSKRRELAGTEALAEDGTPTTAPRGAPAGVTPIRRPATSAERLAERTAIRRAEFERLGGQL